MPHKPPALFLFAAVLATAAQAAPIDRQAVVARHDPHLTQVDAWSPLSVGNGRFAFTADVTGLQTFADHYWKNGTATETQARWSWHTNANPEGYKLSDANRDFTAHGRTLGYPTNQNSPAGQWLRENPHTQPLPRIGFVLAGKDARALVPADVSGVDQRLDLWQGRLESRVTLQGQPVSVTSAADPGTDTVALRIRSPLLARGALAVRIALPRGYDLQVKHNPPLDWSEPGSHRTHVLEQ
jgi:hypothetical protein